MLSRNLVSGIISHAIVVVSDRKKNLLNPKYKLLLIVSAK